MEDYLNFVQGNLESWFLVCNLILTRWNIKDDLIFASAIPSGNDEAKAHLFSSPPSSPVSQMEILANWNIQISLDLD